MNGEIPSVPITTLAGIASLTDLLPEMPLPSPLPQTLSNKSLLFHPRVAEEAHILLSLRDENLVPQLVQSLAQTSADHIELKDHYTGAEPPVEEQNTPELLKAILQRNPQVFKGPSVNSVRGSTLIQAPIHTPLDANHTVTSASVAALVSSSPSPAVSAAAATSSATVTRLTSQPSPSAAVPSIICDSIRKPTTPVPTTPHILNNAAAKPLDQPVKLEAKLEPTTPSEQKTVLVSPSSATNGVINPVRDNNITPPPPPSSVPRPNVLATNLPDASPVQASTAPVPESKNDTILVKRETPVSDSKMKEPRVMLNRIRPEIFVKQQIPIPTPLLHPETPISDNNMKELRLVLDRIPEIFVKQQIPIPTPLLHPETPISENNMKELRLVLDRIPEIFVKQQIPIPTPLLHPETPISDNNMKELRLVLDRIPEQQIPIPTPLPHPETPISDNNMTELRVVLDRIPEIFVKQQIPIPTPLLHPETPISDSNTKELRVVLDRIPEIFVKQQIPIPTPLLHPETPISDSNTKELRLVVDRIPEIFVKQQIPIPTPLPYPETPISDNNMTELRVVPDRIPEIFVKQQIPIPTPLLHPETPISENNMKELRLVLDRIPNTFAKRQIPILTPMTPLPHPAVKELLVVLHRIPEIFDKQQIPIPTPLPHPETPILETNTRELRVVLHRIAGDQALLQRSLKAFTEKSPSLAKEMGLTRNHKRMRIESGSESEEEQPKNKTKYFKARDKEREIQRRKEKDQRKKNENDEDYDGSKHWSNNSKRRRTLRQPEPERESDDSNDSNQVPKTKLRKVERKLVPVLEKLSVEELMETNTYQRFNRSIEKIFNNTDDVDLTMDPGEEDVVPSEAMIPKYQLQDLCSEAAKLKTLGAMESIPSERITRLLSILEKNIRDGTKVSPIADPNDDEDERKLWMELAMERVMRAVDASLTTLYILTSPNMHKRVYLEDVIDRVVIFTKYQLLNTIFPSFDPVYRDIKDKDGLVLNARKKRAHTKEVREKSVLSLYNKLAELVALLAELLSIQTLTDTAVLHISSMGISPFFVEGVSELQLSALKLVTNIFTKYEKHRKLLLDDILASMARLPSSKRSLRSYRLNSEEQIQMLTALVLQLIQCMVVLPGGLGSNKQLDPDTVISNKFTMARTTASNFLYVFLAKCSSKGEEIDYRPLFENFVQDLLTTVNKPEWPAAELMLSVLGKLLVASFVNKSLEMPLRVVSLDYLGVVAARLRKDAVQSNLKLSTIDQIINEIRSEELKDEEGNLKGDISPVTDDEERTQFLQRVLLDYLAVKGHGDPAHTYARHFYLAQWYQDNVKQVNTSPKSKASKHEDSRRSNARNRKQPETYEEDLSENDDEDDDQKRANGETEDPLETYRLQEARKKFLLSKIRPFEDNVSKDGMKNQVLQTYIDYDSAELVSRYLASKRPFSQSFSTYLKHILTVLMESSVLIRTKAMKCLTMIVEVDPAVLGLKSMRDGVNYSFLDHSTSVREAAVDLVGKFVLSRPELIDKYYDMLSARILDTGVSVRKRVIKILKDICIEYPEFPKIPEICVKMIRRVNDEDGIRKLVMEVFQNMWFTPVREKPHIDKEVMIRKVMNITDVVAASEDMGLEWFEQLLVSLFKPKEDKDDSTKVSHEHSKALITACKQIVDCLIDHVLNLDGRGGGCSQRLIACLRTLHLFSKIRPQLLVEHAITLQPYLSLKCQTQGDYQIISAVARTLEIIVPLIEHPSDSFLARLEEDSVKLIMRQDPSVILSCVSCLGSVVNNVTRNYKLIRDCLQKYHGCLQHFKKMSLEGKEEEVEKNRPLIKRSLFIVGLLLRFFDFTDKEVLESFAENTRDYVFETLLFYLEQEELKSFTLKAIGSVCIRHYELMLGPELKALYHDILRDPNSSRELKIQVLSNIEQYLQEEERRMIKQDLEWAKLSKQENLKEMGDVSSGMASTVIQLYLKEILEAFLHPNVGVRQAALRVIQLILSQGLVHPVQIVPYLICMSTDEERMVSNSADKQLQEIEKKYPGFIHMKAQSGIRLSYKLQQILQTSGDAVRGFRLKEGELPGALNGFLYSILRTKQQRRALVLSILKQFDEQVKTSLSQMLYLADNMAYFPYQVQDEPLFIIHHIDIMISVTGTNLLQSFREALLPNPNAPAPQLDPVTGQPLPVIDEEEDEDEEVLMSRVPEDTSTLQECVTASQGCLLLLVLKQHLKTLYGFNDGKITQYSPSETAKVYEKAVNRKSNSKFNPKATLQKIKQGTPPSSLDETAKRALVSEYLEFKHLIMNLDPDESDEEDNSSPTKGSASGGGVGSVNTRTSASGGGAEPVDDRVSEHEHNLPPAEPAPPPRVPKLTIVPPKPPDGKHVHHHRSHKTRKTERHKKHHHKRKKSKLRSSEDESDNDYSDPDFLV